MNLFGLVEMNAHKKTLSLRADIFTKTLTDIIVMGMLFSKKFIRNLEASGNTLNLF